MDFVNDEAVTTPQPYSKLLARNIAAARTRLQLRQSDISERMRAQEVPWYPQTVSEAEQGRRAVKAAELLPLAIALETTVWVLTSASPEMAAVTLPSGEVIGAQRITRMDGSTTWEGNRLKIAPSSRQEPLIESLIAERLAEAETLKAFREDLHRAVPGSHMQEPQPGDLDAEDIPVQRPGGREQRRRQASDYDREDPARAESHDDHGV